MDALKSWVIVQALSLAGGGLAAGAAEVRPRESQPAPAAEQEELDEVLVSGARSTRKASEVMTWMRRLTGQFAYEGHVDLRGQGNPEDRRPVQGTGSCVGFGPAPGVVCEISVTWPEARGEDGEKILGGVSTLDPAMILFGFEPDHDVGVRYMLVDSRGIAEHALGHLTGDTLMSRAPCVNIPGNCQRVTRITAEPDLASVEMRIDLEVDYRKAVGFHFLLRRVSPIPTTPPPGASP